MGKNVSIGIAIVIVVAFTSLGAIAGGIVPAVVFFIASGGGFALWWFTTLRVPVDPMKVIVPYLLSVCFFIVHTYEEWVTGFIPFMSRLSGHTLTPNAFLLVAGCVAPILWLIGAILLLKRTHLGYYMMSFYFFTTLAEFAHFVFPFMENGTFHYTPGMYTALLPFIALSFAFKIVISDTKKARPRKSYVPA